MQLNDAYTLGCHVMEIAGYCSHSAPPKPCGSDWYSAREYEWDPKPKAQTNKEI